MDKSDPQLQYISLLLNNRDLVEDHKSGVVDSKHFTAEKRMLLTAIIEAHENGVSLTRRAYMDFVAKYTTRKADIAAQEILFNECHFMSVDRNEFPMLRAKIVEAFLLETTSKYIKDFNSFREKDGAMHAVKQLAANLVELSTTLSDQKKIDYSDINSTAEGYIRRLEDIRNDRIEKAEFVSFGIEELDKTSGVGCGPGTLTLFIGDVGGFKCGWYKNLLQLSTGERITLQDVHNRVSSGEKVYVRQYDHRSGKLVVSPVLMSKDSGEKLCYRVRTKLNHEITASLDHRHLCFGGYKKVADIVAGDRIAVARFADAGDTCASEEEATVLGFLLAEGGTRVGCTFTNNDPHIVWKMRRCCLNIGGKLVNKHKDGRSIRGEYGVRNMLWLMRQYGLDGKLAIEKSIHPLVFSWNKESISAMLRAMYSVDGRFHFEESKKTFYKSGERSGQGKRTYKVMYCTSSEQLAKDVRDLLLRFNLIASIYEFESYCKKDDEKLAEGPSWRVEISDARQIVKFIKEIGFIGAKQKVALEHLPYLGQLEDNPSGDTIPAAIWDLLNKKFAQYGKTIYGCHDRRGVHENLKNDLGHCGNIGKDISKATLKRVAEYLDNDAELLAIAESDIYWDEVVSIEPIGEQQTYDLAMPNDHNFVCNNIVTHNSTMMLNVAMNIWLGAKKNVLFCPLEMPREYIEDKMVSRALKIPFENLQNPKSLSEEQFAKIKELRASHWQVDGAKFFILDSKEGRVKPSTIKASINQHKEVFKPDVVVVDYIGNMVPDIPRNGRQDIEIGDILKELFHMGKKGVLHENGFGIISGAQIGREALRRVRRSPQDRISFNSEDIRGAHDFAADATAIYALFPDPQAPGERLFVIVVKSRYGKKQFPDGNYKATLTVRPDISLIASAANYFTADSDPSEVLQKLAEQEDDFNSEPQVSGLSEGPSIEEDQARDVLESDDDNIFDSW